MLLALRLEDRWCWRLGGSQRKQQHGDITHMIDAAAPQQHHGCRARHTKVGYNAILPHLLPLPETGIRLCSPTTLGTPSENEVERLFFLEACGNFTISSAIWPSFHLWIDVAIDCVLAGTRPGDVCASSNQLVDSGFHFGTRQEALGCVTSME